MTPHGTMIAVREDDQVRFLLPAIATPHVRIESTIPMFRCLLQEAAIREPYSPCSPARRVLVIQFDDAIHHDIGSVAFCRPRGEAPAVHLVPDTYFLLSRGYKWLRNVVASLPPWTERQNLVFWRGSATNNRTAIDGSPIEAIEQVPRVRLCLGLRGHDWADAAISACWGSDFAPDEQLEYFTKEQIFRPAVTMPQHGSYRYLIDIDGVASAWGFFEKLLLGSCVLKVGSRFEQWFYRELREWQHFVPVRADLGDLIAQIEWCHEHPAHARRIAEEGQQFALAHSFEVAQQIALQAIRSCWLFPG